MNNSEAIKDKYQSIMIELYNRITQAIRPDGTFDSGAKLLIGQFVIDKLEEARSEAFEEALQALPEKKTLDQQAMEVLDNIGKLPLCYSRNIRNELLDEIKEILMQLKGKNA